ncbi:unnamed protein product [Musa hybrid cultivar]
MRKSNGRRSHSPVDAAVVALRRNGGRRKGRGGFPLLWLPSRLPEEQQESPANKNLVRIESDPHSVSSVLSLSLSLSSIASPKKISFFFFRSSTDQTGSFIRETLKHPTYNSDPRIVSLIFLGRRRSATSSSSPWCSGSDKKSRLFFSRRSLCLNRFSFNPQKP